MPTKISPNLQPTVLFEDTHLLVLNKPSGVASQGGEGLEHHNAVDWSRNYLGRHYVGLVHRLDRNVSGTLLIGKRSKAAERLTESLQKGKICRIYHGWVLGKLSKKVTWEDALLKDTEQKKATIADRQSPEAKTAITHAKPIRSQKYRGNDVTLVEFELETGRFHQIRAQSAHHDFPILGDSKYGGRKIALPSMRHRLFLHAVSIEFPHPMSHEMVKIEAPYPDDFLLADRD